MAKLRFPLDDTLRALIAHAIAAPEHSAPYGVTSDPAEALEPHEKEMGMLKADPKKVKPGLFLVHDAGIYLMSNGKPGLLNPNGTTPESQLVSYARGYSPDVEDSWDKCRDAVGGDDFAELLDIDAFAPDDGIEGFEVEVTARSLRVRAILKRRSAKKAA